ncbi:hypothetical protein [Ensifer sp. R-19]|uniref:hypothetical protein n=1 Tax=Ensifer sp. R-19 TaxID=3404055 RepID=UPI003CEB085A
MAIAEGPGSARETPIVPTATPSQSMGTTMMLRYPLMRAISLTASGTPGSVSISERNSMTEFIAARL